MQPCQRDAPSHQNLNLWRRTRDDLVNALRKWACFPAFRYGSSSLSSLCANGQMLSCDQACRTNLAVCEAIDTRQANWLVENNWSAMHDRRQTQSRVHSNALSRRRAP
eukprot:TRINITY_DN83240_c0_g1_i1.p1 TRINITY_DN83240_c0_g1~~TRINITY_DN83240_c0_g1_i1.p1  ORF type:complete len:108 (-),score=5.10 TRINITY_DN83240_c0_g1_i1:59-382(-)